VTQLLREAYQATMGKTMQLLLEEKTEMMCWAAKGVKTKQTASRLGFSVRVICMHLSVLKSLPLNATPPQLDLGPNKTKRTQNLRLKNYICKKNLFKSARELKNDVQGCVMFP
jgi:hypothetical protein